MRRAISLFVLGVLFGAWVHSVWIQHELSKIAAQYEPIIRTVLPDLPKGHLIVECGGKASLDPLETAREGKRLTGKGRVWAGCCILSGLTYHLYWEVTDG